MRSLVAVCDAHLVTMEEQRRRELAAIRRQARFERYRDKCNRKIEMCDADLAVSVSYDGSRMDVRVQNPLTHLPKDGPRYTTYEIAISTNNIAFTLPKSYVRRRYSEFTWLRKQLAIDHVDLNPPSLPPKTWWGGQFEPQVIEHRLRGLKTFLEAVLLERVYLSNKALHLFVQSQLYTAEIENVLNGRDKRSVADHVLESSRLCMSCARCPSCRDDVIDDQSSCSSCDSKQSDDECDSGVGISPQELGTRTDDLHDLEKSGSDLERSAIQIQKVPQGDETLAAGMFRTSTPQRSWSDSALVLHNSHELDCSSDSDSSDFSKDGSGSECPDSSDSLGVAAVSANHGKIKPVLSHSLPTARGKFMRCLHRKRRVTFSTEVTVAKVLEKPEDEEESEGQSVSLVKIHENKDRTKGQ